MSAAVKIQYGIFSGEGNGTRLRRALRRAGYTITKDTNKADILLCHSAGCFWLPEKSTSQKIILIDPPYWPGRTVRERAKSRSKRNFHFRDYDYLVRYWLIRNIWGAYYAVRDFKRTLRIVHYAPFYDLPTIIHDRPITIVRNEHDDWLTPELTALQKANQKLSIVRLPGDHDDITHNPERYVSLVQSIA